MTIAGFVMDTNSFETNLHGWTTGGMDQPFTRLSGSTPSVNTGPSTAAKGSYYVYAETSGCYNMDFDLQKNFVGGQELYGMAFQYHMYGSTMGSAVLESSADGASWVSLWSKSGNMGNQWLQATVYAGSGQTMLRFTYTSGSSYTGDFALDDVQIGDCLTVGCSSSPNNVCMMPGGTCDSATGRCTVYADGTTCDSETTDKLGAALKHRTLRPKSMTAFVRLVRD